MYGTKSTYKRFRVFISVLRIPVTFLYGFGSLTDSDQELDPAIFVHYLLVATKFFLLITY
jgi:hypothetical protein